MKVLLALLENMRPKQWTKNAFVFAGLVFDQKLLDAPSFGRVMLTFGLLCATASAIYLINDIVDVEKDRQHPKKKNRPIASGRLPMGMAWGAAALLMGGALFVSLLLSWLLTLVLLVYIVIHILYSYWLKNIVIIDVFAIAAGFILRVLAGVVVIEVEQFSPWLYVCMGLLALFLAVGKRRNELLTLGEAKATTTRQIFKEYNLPLLDDMLRLTIASAAIAYTLYVTEADTTFFDTELRLLTIPFVYYGLFRYLYVIYVQEHGGDPTEILFEDRPLQANLGLWGLLVIALLYLA